MNARIGANLDYIEGVDLVKAHNAIDLIEHRHSDAFINILSDVNFGILNKRFDDSDFTYVSTTGRIRGRLYVRTIR